MSDKFEHLGKYFPQWLGGVAMTAAEQGALDKLSNINRVTEYVFCLFFYCLHIDISNKLWVTIYVFNVIAKSFRLKGKMVDTIRNV
jgi:hypothetical protein